MGAERFFQRFADFSRALTRLDEAMQGVEVYTPAQVLAEALQAGPIIDGNGWSRMQESRNCTSHTCDLALAEAVGAFLRSQGLALFRQLELSLQHQGPR